MFGLVATLLGGAISPLVEQITAFGARLLRKLALFAVAFVCLVVVLIALTIAFDLWIATHFGPIVGALAVAFLYLLVAVASVVLALRDRPRAATAVAEGEEAALGKSGLDEQIDQFTSPLMRMLGQFGLRREQLAVLAGGSIAKKVGPIPLVGLAIVAGFLIGRTWKAWRDLLTIDALASLLSMASLFGFGVPAASDDADSA